MKIHKVKQGEDMLTIASKYRIAEWEQIYDHKANQRLKKMRPDPMCLFPGDIVYIPDTQPITFTLATNKKHVITVPVPKAHVSIQVMDEEDKPLKGVDFELKVGKTLIKKQTDGEGYIKENVPLSGKLADLTVWPDPNDKNKTQHYQIKIGDLDPVEEVSGVQQRLRNQGVDTGSIDNDFGVVTNQAVNSLHSEQGSEPKPISDQKTKDLLEK